MSLAVVYSRAQDGVGAPLVTCEVHLSGGLPGTSIVGLPETAVKEARDRVRAAIQNAQLDYPQRRITVNLAPADLPKDGGRFDLPIALGILAANGGIPRDALARYEFIGELALSGELRAVHGVLPAVLHAARAGRRVVVPRGNADEAALARDADVRVADSLLAVCAHLAGRVELAARAQADERDRAHRCDARSRRRARTTAGAARARNRGGRCASSAARRSARHRQDDAREPPRRASCRRSKKPKRSSSRRCARSPDSRAMSRRWKTRAFRAPHHTASAVALVGGGSLPRPGEISLAHHGVLFLDELPEFDRHVLEVLREPLESGHIAISRAARQAEFPARFQLVAAMNPCPCGYAGDASGRCRCTPDAIARYRQRVSGPLLDRIDLKLEMPRVPQAELARSGAGRSRARRVRERVIAARARQLARAGKPNAALGNRETERDCALDARSHALLDRAIERLGLSARAYHRVLRVARTIADLAGHERIDAAHLLESIQYRRFDPG